jgi:hypothetical protein
MAGFSSNSGDAPKSYRSTGEPSYSGQGESESEREREREREREEGGSERKK